jgi:hypothetical protein
MTTSTARQVASAVPGPHGRTLQQKGSNTFSSQTAAVVNINGVVMYVFHSFHIDRCKMGNSALIETPRYMGDRWESDNLMTTTYVWLPLTISGTTATLHNEVNWVLDIAGGTWKSGPTESSFEAEDRSNAVAGGAKVADCANCSGAKDVGYVGGKPGGTLTFPNVSSSVATNTTIRIHYVNGDKSRRFANVVVNGVGNVVAFLQTSGTAPGASALTAPLKGGSANVVEFEAYNGGWGKFSSLKMELVLLMDTKGPDIDRLMVPQS